MKPGNVGQSRRYEIFALLAILLLAAVLRMAWPGLTEFKRDEALLLSRALDMAEFQQFHTRGISSSIGFPNFPMSVWLYALPLLAWKHVYAATLFTGLLNTAAVLGCWWLGRRYWGSGVGLAAALLYAASPWAVFHSQKIWAQNLLAPLVVGWAISGALAFVEGRRPFVLLHLLCLAIAIQVHFAALALLPATLIFLVVFRRRVDWRLTIAGGLLGLVLASPFFVYLLGSDFRLDEMVTGATDLERPFSLSAWRYLWLLSTGREIHALAGPEVFEAFLAGVPDLTLVHIFWAGLMLAGLIYLGREAWSKRGSGNRPAEVGFLILVWFLVPPLFFSLPLLPVELHYLLPTNPAAYLAAGLTFSLLLSRLKKWQWAGWAVLGLSAAAQAWVWLALLNLIARQATPGGYGTPVKYHLEAAGTARRLLGLVDGGEVLIGGEGEQRQQDEFAAIYDVLLRDVPHRFVDLRRSAVFPGGPAVALLNPQIQSPAAGAYREAAGQITRLPLRHDEGLLQVLLLPPAAAPEPEINLEPTYLFANWISLFGHDLLQPQDGGMALWKLYWHPGANPDQADYHFFNQLLDGSGELIGQEDAPAFAPWQWQAGDTVISFFNLPWPAAAEEPWSMRTGIYAYPALNAVPVLDVAGNPTGDYLELAPVK